MGLGSHYATSPRMCLSTEDYIEWMHEHYNNSGDDDEKIIPKWYYLPLCNECENIESLQLVYVLTIDHIDF